MLNIFKKLAKRLLSGNKTDKVDLSSMTKEEIAAYYEKQLLKQAKNQTRIIQGLRGELSKSNKKLQNNEKVLNQTKEQLNRTDAKLKNADARLKSTDEKLKNTLRRLEEAKVDREEFNNIKKYISGFKDLVTNILDNVRERHYDYLDCLKDENIPSVDVYNLKSLNIYFEGLITDLLNTLPSLYQHRSVALSLGTSEKTKGASATEIEDFSADLQAKEDGAVELESASQVVQEDSEEKDFEEQSSELRIANTKAITPALKKEADGLTPEQIDSVILSGCTSRIKSETEGLAEITSLLKDSCESIKNDTKSLNETLRQQRHYVSTTSGSTIAGIISYGGKREVTMYCEECNCQRLFKFLGKNKRVNEITTIDGSLQHIRKVLGMIQQVKCCTCGALYEINPAQYTEVNFTRSKEFKNEHSNSFLNTSGTDSEYNQDASETHSEQTEDSTRTNESADTSAKENIENQALETIGISSNALMQRNRKKLYRQISSSQNAVTDTSMLTGKAMICKPLQLPVINPFEFNAEVFGHAPAFLKSRISTALFAVCGTQFSQLGAPKNRIFCLFEGNGLEFGREHLTGAINAFARAYLHPVAEQIKKDILRNCPVIIMDESTLLVTETANKKQAEGKGRKSQIWTMNTSWTSEIQASYYTVSPSRSADVVVDLLKDTLMDEDGHITVKYALTDGYTGYDAALKTLNKILGTDLVSCRCHTHGRRGLWKYLKSNGLLDVYSLLLPEGAAFTDFKDNLEKYLKTKKGKKLSDNSIALLTIFYLINALFVIDSSIVRKHGFICTTEEFKYDLITARNKYSSKIVDALFDSIRLYIASNPKIIVPQVSKDGNIRFTRNKRYPESAALIYLLNYETELKRFVESADIELSTSKAERSLKLGICSRKSFMFLASEDGGHAFADYQTIVNTCNLNGVPTLPYMIWLVANIKYRMQLLENEGRGGAMGLSMPKKESILVEQSDGSMKKVLISMYDKRNIIDFDKIDVTGLMPYDYKRYLDAKDQDK